MIQNQKRRLKLAIVYFVQPQTPVTPQGQTTSKTLFVGNLSFSVERADV